MGFNLSDLRVAMSSKDWEYVVKLPNTMGRLPIDAAILSGCLITFDLLARHYQPTECLRRAIDHCATDVAAHIIRSDSGTIFCDERESDQPPCRTALHYAAVTSNTAMIRFLVALRVSWTNKHIQHLMTKTNSIRRNHTPDLQLYRWDPIFNMLDLNDMGRTALEIAADQNDKKSFEAILQQERDDSGIVDISQDILSIVVKSGRANIVKTLLQRCESPYCNLPLSTGSLKPSTSNDSTNFSSLPTWNFIFHATFHAASGELQLNALEQLLALCKDKDIGIINGVDSKHFWKNDRIWNGWLPIHYAVYCGRVGVIRAFIAADIWSLDEMTGNLTRSPYLNLDTEMPKWYLAFRYDSLFAQISSKTPHIADPYPSSKEAISEKGKTFRTMVSAVAKGVMSSVVGSNLEVDRTGASSTANSTNGESIPKSLYRYKYYDLWGHRSTLDMDHDDYSAHDLIWGLRDCLTMARDLVNLNDHVWVPGNFTRERQPIILYKKSREDIIIELQRWKNEKLKMTIADGALEVLDIEKNVRRLLNEVDDVTRAGNVLATGEATVTVEIERSPAPE
jgi:ankyrin repeat protein